MKARRVSKRRAPRHGGGTLEQLQAWGAQWARFRVFKREQRQRTFEKPNQPFSQDWAEHK